VLASRITGNVMDTLTAQIQVMKPIVGLVHVMTVYMIGQLMALNAVIQLPMSMV